MMKRNRPKYCYAMGRGGYLYFRRGAISARMPDDPTSQEFKEIYDRLIAEFESDPLEYNADSINKNELDQLFEKLERGARSRSKRAGREYCLPKYWGADAYTKQEGRCAITGVLMRRPKKAWDQYGPSIDRIDSSKGYTPENCHLTLVGVNKAKGELEMGEFEKMCLDVVNNKLKRIMNGT